MKVISTTKAPAAIGPYSQAIQVGNLVYTSGQIPIDPATGVFTVTKATMVTPVVPAAAGNLAALNANGQLVDTGDTVATDAEVTEMLTEVFGE